MQAPIYNFLLEYSNKQMLRMHMPDIRVRLIIMFISVYPLDITEISGADSL